MPAVERVSGAPWRLLLVVAVAALLAGVHIGREQRGEAARAQASSGDALPQSRPPVTTREPTFEEELERLHPQRDARAATCRAGSGSGGCGCCGGRAGSGSGSGTGAGSGEGQCGMRCGVRSAR